MTATGTDICDADVTITSDEPAIYPLGTTTVTFTATDDSGNSATMSMTVTVVDTTPPDVDAGPDVTVEQATAAGTEVTLSGSAGDICDASPDYEWSDGIVIGNALTLTKVFNLGTHTLTLKATDDSGNTGTDTLVVNVVDTTPPDITIIEPANGDEYSAHCHSTITINFSVSDICDADPEIVSAFIDGEPVENGQVIALHCCKESIFYHRGVLTLGLGEHILTVTAVDDSGNVGIETSTFSVVKECGGGGGQ